MKFPNRIHAIWLGNPLGKEGRKNLEAWKGKNPSAEICLWIDSSLFLPGDDKNGCDYSDLKEWAKINQILIADLAIPEDKSDLVVKGKLSFYEKMLSKSFYGDEVNGKYKNLAAASDILRLEILYQLGGIYIDVVDVFPGDKSIENLTSPFGFLYRQDSDFVNNDVLASIPRGSVIAAIRQAVNDNYQKLYLDETKLIAHRNPDYTSPLIYAGENSRKQTTLVVSGPGAMDTVISNLVSYATVIPEAKHLAVDDVQMIFPKEFYKLPERQAASWFDREADSKFESVIPVFRNYVRTYFNELIEAAKQQLKSSTFIASHAKENARTLALLLQLKQHINAFSPSHSMIDVYETYIKKIKESDVFFLNIKAADILQNLKNCSYSLEELVNYFKKHNDPKEISNLLKNLGVKFYNKYQLKDFVNDVLNIEGGHPGFEKLNKYNF